MALPVPGPPIYQLAVKDVFDGLNRNEKLYVHHLSKAAWLGARIVMRQALVEGPGIFDFIMSLHGSFIFLALCFSPVPESQFIALEFNQQGFNTFREVFVTIKHLAFNSTIPLAIPIKAGR